MTAFAPSDSAAKSDRISPAGNSRPFGLPPGERLDFPTSARQAKPANSAVAEVLSTPGQPLEPALRAYMEPRFGHDFSQVRIHSDHQASESAREVNALAYTVGQHVVFDAGQYGPSGGPAKFLLAHELAHTLQQRGGPAPSGPVAVGIGSDQAEWQADQMAGHALAGLSSVPFAGGEAPVLRRFEKSEKDQISRFDEVLKTAGDIGQASSRPNMFGRVTIDWGEFVKNAGGLSVGDAMRMAVDSGTPMKPLPNRYMMTCRCGMVDMRHLYELVYVARFYRDAPFFTAPEGANRVATKEGRDHELHSEKTSQFAPEDTPSNALGAHLGSKVEGSGSITSAEFVAQLRDQLHPCLPIDFKSLPAPEQDKVVDYYGARDVAGVPSNQNETATPAALSLSVCSNKTQTFPFEVSATDPDKKTITNVKAPYRLSGDTEIRDWVSTAPRSEIADLPDWEMIRLVQRLLDGWVSDDDVEAIEKICGSANTTEVIAIDGAVRPRLASLSNTGQQVRVTIAISRR